MTSLLDEFERLYDPRTGGWHIPEKLVAPFTPEDVEKWLAEHPLRFSPVEREVGRFFAALIHLLQPSTVLETGTNFGYSAYSIAGALRLLGGNRKLFTIDLWSCDHLFKGTEAEPSITFIQGNSLEIDLGVLPSSFDMLFLDSDHTYKTIVGEMNRFAPMLRMHGFMVLHDTLYYDGVALAVKQLMDTGAFEVVNFPTPRDHGRGTRPPGISIARKVRKVKPGFLKPKRTYLNVEINLSNRKDTDASLL